LIFYSYIQGFQW